MAAIRHPKDFWSGVLFIAIGVSTIVAGSKYTLGTAARMGPGYFPRILGILLIALGALGLGVTRRVPVIGVMALAALVGIALY